MAPSSGGAMMDARRRGGAGRNGRKEPAMKFRNVSAGITRFVVLGAMAASLFFGSAVVGPHHEAAAASSGCETILNRAKFFYSAGKVAETLGETAKAIGYYNQSIAYYDSYFALCS